LYLAAVAVGSQGNAEQAAQRFTGGDRVVAGYLREILDSMEPAVVEFLVRTCVLERLSAGLCDAVRGGRDSAAVLEGLRRSGLFVVALDRTGDWYRFQRLFQDLLRAELRQRFSDEQPVLHRRASLWWEAHGDLDAAVRHAYAAGDLDRFAGLVWSATPTYLASSRLPDLVAWMGLPSPQQIASSAPLSLAAAWLNLTHRTNLDQLRDDVRHLGDRSGFDADLKLLRATRGQEGVESMVADASSAYELADPRSPWKGMACLLAGAGLRLHDHRLEAAKALDEGFYRTESDMPEVAALCATELSWLSIDEDDWESAEAHAHRSRTVLDEHDITAGSGAFAVFSTSAWMSARFGDIDAANQYAQRAMQAVSDLRTPLPIAVESRLALGRALLLLDDVRTARRLVNEAGSLSSHVPDFEAVTQKVAGLRSDIDAAISSAGAVIPLTPAELRVLRYLPTHLSFQAIGRDLIVSPNTVKTQAIAVYRKLGVSSRAAAVRKAKEQGLLPEGETSHYPSEYRHTGGGLTSPANAEPSP
jgi:LuxR family maltose regulon positive regulatory protein